MHLLGFHISFPPKAPKQGAQHVMCRGVQTRQVNAIHEWMDAGKSDCTMRMQLAVR